jgi:NADPH-dependent 2,4-dienoyl-CoA reductase/sulfur reductase-like enzyme
MASPIADYPKTGIQLVVVGAGFGGLTTAIESHLKGHMVIVVEKAPQWEQLGDIISISEYFHLYPKNRVLTGEKHRSKRWPGPFPLG